MPTYQGMEFLERVLEALSRQRCEALWSFFAIDSGSSDGTWECLEAWRDRLGVPVQLERIHKVEFDHGDTRNLLAARAGEVDVLVFLTQDAIPATGEWLQGLLDNFDDAEVGGAYCRNVPRPDCDLLTRVFSRDDPGYASERRVVRMPERAAYDALSVHEKRLLYNFNDVASAIRRDLWQRHPFPRTSFGEDVLMARALIEAGCAIVYDAQACVEHSHDYDAGENWSRAHIDGRFSAEWLDRTCIESQKDARVLTERVLAGDIEQLDSMVQDSEARRALVARARDLRRATFDGLYEGGRTAKRFPATRMLEAEPLSILYVVHGFPPDTWAGTEIYTYNIATEMQRRGMRCTVLTRVPADDNEHPDFHVEESEFQGLRVLRMTHRLGHASMRESYQQPKAEAAFRTLLAQEQPDLVHFQHLIHTSAGLVQCAQEFGLPTVITCHDYWALCARVQLIRPDGAICDHNMGSGCFACVKEEGMQHVDRLAKLDKGAGELVRSFAREAAVGERSSPVWRRRSQEYTDLRDRESFVLDAYASADLRISPSRFLRSKLLESGAFDPTRFLFSDNGMRTDHIHALEKQPDSDGRIRFGFVGSLVWYKGGEVLVRAMAELAASPATRAGCVMNIYGDFKPASDEHHAELKRIADAFGAAVEFKGRFDNAKLSEVYAEIDVLVVPSVWYENSPITIHEAQLTKTPVLASDIGGMAEFVRDGIDGLHFRVGDAGDLAAKMRRFVKEPDLLASLSLDFPVVKTIAQNGEEMDFRYRALCCIERPGMEPGSIMSEWSPREATPQSGSADEQGESMLLLRPASSLSLDLGGLRGSLELELDLFLLAGEADVEHALELRVDGRELGVVAPQRAAEKDETRSFRFPLDATGEASKRLLLTTTDRVCRLSAIRVLRGTESPAELATGVSA